jgi:hypothetical protein
MSTVAGNQREFIPGYRLLERLGHGGFGEVWKAEAPGGLFKAIKIVYGTLDGMGGFDAPARQELKALERVKSVRHPFILSLERFDIVNGQLVIVTELADKNLGDRFNECTAQGLPGIPREELLRHMAEAAEALDMMNVECQLQHLDIKPQNLFLVYNHVKVADFGLVKDLAGKRTQMTSGITAGYAPPETFEGLVSPYCDQYSLAVVYQELLTGQLPFAGNNPRQLMMQHVSAAPNLEPLPAQDRAAVAQALAKKPEDRHASCGAFVRALCRGAVEAPVAPSPPALAAAPDPSPRPETIEIPPAAEDSQTVFTGPARPDLTVEQPPRPRPAPAPEIPVTIAVEPAPAQIPERPEVEGEGLLFPAVVIGLGAAGRETLRCLRKAMCKRWGADGLSNVRLLLIDADPDELLKATQGETDTALHGETLLARLHRPSYYLKPGRESREMQKWLEPDVLLRLPRDQTTPEGWRILGRLAFASNESAISARLATELAHCTDEETLAAAARKTGLGLRSNRPRVYIVGDLGSGTGSGMFLDVANAARQGLRQIGFPRAEVLGLLLLPPVERSGEKARATANAFAALTELNYFSARATAPAPPSSDNGRPVLQATGPFSGCYLLPVPRGAEQASWQELAIRTGEFLVRELATPLARAVEEARARLGQQPASAAAAANQAPSPATHATAQTGMVCQTFGAYWFAVPRRILLQRVARSLFRSLVKDWRADDPKRLETRVRSWVDEQLGQFGLSPEALAGDILKQASTILQRPADEEVQAVLAVYRKDQPQDLGSNQANTTNAIAAVDQLVGPPGSAVATGAASLAEILRQAVAGLAGEAEERLADLALRALTEPHFRLMGVEDRVLGLLGSSLAELARSHRAEAEKLARQAAKDYSQVAPVLEALRRGSFWGWGKKDRLCAEFLDLLRSNGKLRYQAMLSHAQSALYGDLHGSLHKYQLNVDCCHGRIADFLKGIEDSATEQANVDLGLGQYLLPAGCKTLAEAVKHVLACLSAGEREEINRRVQGLISRAFEAKVHVCTAPADFFKELEEEVLREVAAFAEAPLGRAHAAEMYLAQRGQRDTAVDELAGAFQEAVPELASASTAAENQLNILAVPPGPEGDHFRRLVHEALPDQELVPAPSTDDIVFYREVSRLPLAALPQMGPAATEVYRQVLQADPITPHSRTDITNWQPASRGIKAQARVK